ILPPPPSSTPFPYTTLFRSRDAIGCRPRILLADEFVRDFRRRSIDTRRHVRDGRNRRRTVLRADIPPRWQLLASLNLREFPLLRSEEHTSELQSRGHLVCRL